MTIVTIGIDLAKNVFAVHGVDATGNAVLVRPSLARTKLLELIASLPACLIGMKACSGVLKVAAGSTTSPLDALAGWQDTGHSPKPAAKALSFL